MDLVSLALTIAGNVLSSVISDMLKSNSTRVSKCEVQSKVESEVSNYGSGTVIVEQGETIDLSSLAMQELYGLAGRNRDLVITEHGIRIKPDTDQTANTMSPLAYLDDLIRQRRIELASLPETLQWIPAPAEQKEPLGKRLLREAKQEIESGRFGETVIWGDE